MRAGPTVAGETEELGMPPSINPEKARTAAANPLRPGEHCGAERATYVPVVDRNRCEGKSDCVEVCPFAVFQVRRIDDADFEKLSFFGKLKSRAHGRQTAYTPGASACQACGLCVVSCPEDAILLAVKVAVAKEA
jgi:NAD-dependent dihydropyrimidine dehydrogenase PreA subunit